MKWTGSSRDDIRGYLNYEPALTQNWSFRTKHWACKIQKQTNEIPYYFSSTATAWYMIVWISLIIIPGQSHQELALATKVRGPWQINNVTCHQVLNNILHPANNILSSDINPDLWTRNKSQGNKIISFYFLPLPDSASIWTKYTSWSFISDLA